MKRLFLFVLLLVLCLPAAAQYVDLTKNVKNILPVANGGTGNTTGAGNAGTLSWSDTGVLSYAQGSANSYVQYVVQNTNSGAAASADIIVSNNLGTATTFYGDFGINSSTFAGTGSLNIANATYLYSANGDIVFGTLTSNGIHFVVNNGATDAVAISSSGAITVNGATAITGTLSATGQITSTLATGTAPFAVASTTPVTNLSIGGNAATSTTATTATNQSGGTVSATTISASGQITSTLATGSAPLVVASTTPVANLSIGGNAATATTATSATTATTATTATNLSGGTVNATTIEGTAYEDSGGRVIISSTAPSISSGFGTSPTITAHNTAAFLVRIGTSPGTTGVLTLPSSTTGWICDGQDLTTPSETVGITASAAASVTLTFYGRTTGTATAPTAADNILIKCAAF